VARNDGEGLDEAVTNNEASSSVQEEEQEEEPEESHDPANNAVDLSATNGDVVAVMARSIAAVVEATRARVAPTALEVMDRAFNRMLAPAFCTWMATEYPIVSEIYADAQRARLVDEITTAVMSRPAVHEAIAVVGREADPDQRQRAQARAADLAASLGAIEGRRLAETIRRPPPMFRLRFRQPCLDCGDSCHQPICHCGYMRPLTDEFFVVPALVPIGWSRSGPWPRLLGFTEFELYRIRAAADAISAFDLDADLDGDGWGGGSGFGNGDGWGGGGNADAINKAFTARASQDSVAPQWSLADSAGFEEDDSAVPFPDADAASGTLADFVVETFERWLADATLRGPHS
jgi:hypothetical protein